jgi:hypothetical protein
MFLRYIFLSVASLWLCFRFMPQTNEVALERIERKLRAGPSVAKIGNRLIIGA